MNKYRELLEQALQLAAAGDQDAGLKKLDEGIRLATESGENNWVALLSRNAGLLYEQKGALELAKRSYELALAHNKSDPYLSYALADVCKRLGLGTLAERHFKSSFELALEADDDDLVSKLSELGYGKVPHPS